MSLRPLPQPRKSHVKAGPAKDRLRRLHVVAANEYRRGPSGGTEKLVGASGTALSPLTPTGMARVNHESWTAESLSGPLPAGAPVHVVRVDGLRLLVWSEAGAVPGDEALSRTTKQKEEP
jgi:membrane-bound ClpP family serine protease